MKHFYFFILLLISTISFAQTDPCVTCVQLDTNTTAWTKEQTADYYTTCYKKDSIGLSDGSYQITYHHRCRTYKRVSVYNTKQEIILGYSVEEKDTLFTYTDTLPEFKGGSTGRNKFLSKHVIYPREAEKKGLEGRVVVSLYIDEQGKVYKSKLKQKIFPDLDEEALRVIALFPDFTPGKYQGVNKKFMISISIVYKLPE